MNRTANIIAAEIKAWDRQDIRVLRDLIAELSASCDDTQAYIDMSNLPTNDIPADVDTSYPVWAVDAKGQALVGDGADRIETLDQVRARQ